MKIGMQTWGSRGDVMPFVHLAGGLAARGHDVTLAVSTGGRHAYWELASRFGFRLILVHDELIDAPAGVLEKIVRTIDPVEEIRLLNEHFFDPFVDDLFEASAALCSASDIVIGHFWLHPLMTAATLAKVPRVTVHLCPIALRSVHVPAAGPNLGKWLNGLLWDLGDYAMSRRLFRTANDLRVRHGLEPVRSLHKELLVSDALTLVATSPALCPRQPDWGDNIEVTGFLAPARSDHGTALPEDIRRFLEAGDPPVYFTFGSCEVFYGEANLDLFLETVDSLGVRAIVQTGYADKIENPDTSRILVVEETEHALVFPECSLVVHHGGAGTTQTALRAGKPSVVVEHGFDQSYWGRALGRAGVAAQLLYRRSVTPVRLARAIRRVLQSAEIAPNARVLAQSLANEDGVGRSVEVIERRFDRPSGGQL